MSFFDKMERKFGRYAIHNLMKYIIVLYGVGFVLFLTNPAVYYRYLSLDASMILKGQIWRIFTFMICPPSSGVLYFLIAMWLYFMLGQALEVTWGAFRFNVYFFGGVIGHVLAAIIIYLVSGTVIYLDTSYLNMSLFLAFAATFPDMQFFLFFILPIKAKWLGLIDAALFVMNFISGDFAARVAILLSFANFLIFFYFVKGKNVISPKQVKRKVVYQQQVQKAQAAASRPRHRCAVCGRTEFDDPNLEFRYCSKCEGSYEYCMDHLYTHVHVKTDIPEEGQ